MDLVAKIVERMPVVTSDGRAIGFVDSIRDGGLTVTSVREGRGFNHVVPFSWIVAVDRYVFLNKGSAYVAANCAGEGAPAHAHRSSEAA